MLSAESVGIALGLFLALAVFALKTAAGIYYRLALPGARRFKLIFTGGLLTGYVLLFLLAFALLDRVVFFLTADSSAFLKNGAALHLLLCAGLLVWGIRLLLRRDDETPDRISSRGWLLLAVPCPVCLSAIFLVCAFARMLFPDSASLLRWLVPVFFLLSNLLFLLLMIGLGRFFRIRPLVLTARMMIAIALYFILILLLAPQFQEAGKLYAAARSGGVPVSSSAGWIVLLAIGAFGGGFVWNMIHEKTRS